MKTILITGINGFLGSNLAKALSTDYKIIGLEFTLENLFRIANYNFIVYSAKDGVPDDLFYEQKVDIIIHTATFYAENNDNFQLVFNSNLLMPCNLLEKAIHNGCKVFINTDTVLDRFVNIYSLSKRHFQEWLYIHRNSIKIINMQLEFFYGPGAPKNNFISAIINKLSQNVPVIDLTLGEQKRDFIFIKDVVNAFLIVIKNLNKLGKSESYLNFEVCSNKTIEIKELVILLKLLTNSTTQLNFGAIPYRPNELMQSISNNNELMQIGWQPETSLEIGLQETILTIQNIIYG